MTSNKIEQFNGLCKGQIDFRHLYEEACFLNKQLARSMNDLSKLYVNVKQVHQDFELVYLRMSRLLDHARNNKLDMNIYFIINQLDHINDDLCEIDLCGPRYEMVEGKSYGQDDKDLNDLISRYHGFTATVMEDLKELVS